MILLLGWALAADPDPLAPDLQGLGMTVTTAADGLGRADRWTAVDVTLVNVGPDTDATVSVSVTDATRATPLTVTYERTAELPRGTKRRVWMPIRLPPGGVAADVSMTASDGRHLSRPLQVRYLDEDAVGVGVIGESGLGIQALAQAWGGPVPGRATRPPSSERDVRVGLLDVDTLPTVPVAYDALDWVIWPAADPTRVDDGAERALLDWVADGGHLLVTVSDTWSRVGGSPLGDALPVQLTGVDLLDNVGDFTGPLGGAASAGGPVPVAAATVRDVPGREAWVLADDARERPLWVIGTYGLGTVTVIPLDPSLTAVAAAIPRERLWRRLLWLPAGDYEAAPDWFEASDLSAWRDPYAGGPQLLSLDSWPADGAHLPKRLAAALHLGAASRAVGVTDLIPNGTDPEGDSLRDWLATIPGVAPLPLSWLLVFAGAYLLVIGPIDGIVLRLLRREPWTWITFPVWIGLFSALALGVTSVTKGSESRAIVIDLVDALPGTDRWRGDSYLGLFAAARVQPAWRSSGERGVVAPMEGESRALWDVALGEGVAAWRAETWSLGLLRDRWFAPASGAVRVVADGAGWRIENDLPYEAYVVVLAEDRAWPIGTVGAGKHKTVVPASVGRDRIVSAAELPDLAVATDVEVAEAVEPWFARSGRGRGAMDVAWHRPVVVAVSRAPVTPLVLEGVDPQVQRIGVLRFPVAPDLVAPHVGAVQPVALGTDAPLLQGTKVEIRAIAREDAEYADRATWVGKACFVEWDLYATEGRWYSGNIRCDGQSRWFSKVSLVVLELPIPWPLGFAPNNGDTVEIVEVGPGDTLFDQKGAWIGKRCTVENLYASAPLGWASGGLVCDGASTYFSQVYARPYPLPATWSPPLAKGDLVRVEEIGTDDPIAFAPTTPPLGSTCTVDQANPGDAGWYAGQYACGGAVVRFVHVKLSPVPAAATP